VAQGRGGHYDDAGPAGRVPGDPGPASVAGRLLRACSQPV